jgi:hypothetical protein
MADISDVEQAMTNAAISILYPAGSSQSSIIGTLCRVYRGWPNPATLNTDLADGTVNVTIITDNDSGRITTRYLPEWHGTTTLPGVAASASTPWITISGYPAVGDMVGALIDGIPYAYRIESGDTPALVASNLNHLIQVDRPSTVQGTVIDVPGSHNITVRVVCDNDAFFESRRQEKDLRVICWCPNPTIRDAVAAAIDTSFDQVAFLSLVDHTNARVSYRNTSSYDQSQNALLYRRDLVYTVEYPTIKIIRKPSMLFGSSDINNNIIYG